MTRGRHPKRAMEEADRIAKKRGAVHHYQYEPGSICDFTIMSPGCIAQVRIKRVRRLCCCAKELERTALSEIAALRTIASSPAICREIWFCSPTYAWRFFRTGDHALSEIGCDGQPVVGEVSAPAPGTTLRYTPTKKLKGSDTISDHLG